MHKPYVLSVQEEEDGDCMVVGVTPSKKRERDGIETEARKRAMALLSTPEESNRSGNVVGVWIRFSCRYCLVLPSSPCSTK